MGGHKWRFAAPKTLSPIRRFLSGQLPEPNFIIIHYAYFIGLSLIVSVIFWGSSTPARSISYTDSLFHIVSAMTVTGLNTVNLSAMNTFQQFILFLMTMLGSAILVSIAVIFVRLKAFERRFKSIVEEEKRKKKERGGGLRRAVTGSILRRQTSIDLGGGTLHGRPRKTYSGIDDGVKENDAEKGGPMYPIAEESPKVSPQESSEESTQNSPKGSVKNGHPVRGPLTVNTNLANNKPEEGDKYGENCVTPAPNRITRGRGVTFVQSPTTPPKIAPLARMFSMKGVGARQDLMNSPVQIHRQETTPKPLTAVPEHEESWDWSQLIHRFKIPRGNVGRNSQFSDLSFHDRERLGGVEYRTLTILAVIVPLYFISWQFLGALGLGAWVANNARDLTDANGLNPWWVGAFNAISGFNNSGMSLLDANMTAFSESRYTLITLGLLILAGNTCFPVFLRLIIWTMWRLLPDSETCIQYKVTLRFLLDHPRRCYTNMFPSRHTWWLLATLICLNGIDWIAFEVLNIGNQAIFRNVSHGTRAIDGLFQALAVRSGGFYVVTLSNLRIGLLILYVVMMYISVYPVVITMRSSNVYEERSLGIYSNDTPPEEPLEQTTTANSIPNSKTSAFAAGIAGFKRSLTSQPNPATKGPVEGRGYFIQQQLRGQLAHDLWWVVLAVLFITIIETSSFERDPVHYSVFNILFEVVSAYGTVGLSIGLPDQAYSFSGGWHTMSKLILCAVMLRGRHRGLPVAIDRAVLLPGEHLAIAEEQDAKIRLDRTGTRTSGQECAC